MCFIATKNVFEDSGFTLIELLLVLSIISVLAAVQLPRLNEFSGKIGLRSEAETLRMSMLTARMKASMERREVRLILGTDLQTYWFEEQEDPLNAPETYLHVASGVLGRTVHLESQICLNSVSEVSLVRFMPSARIENGDVELVDKKGNCARIYQDEKTKRMQIDYSNHKQVAWNSAY